LIFHLAMFLHYHDLFILVFQKWKLDDIGFTRLWLTSLICEWHSCDINKIEELEHFRIVCSGVVSFGLYPAIPQSLVLSRLQSCCIWPLINLNAKNWTWIICSFYWSFYVVIFYPNVSLNNYLQIIKYPTICWSTCPLALIVYFNVPSSCSIQLAWILKDNIRILSTTNIDSSREPSPPKKTNYPCPVFSIQIDQRSNTTTLQSWQNQRLRNSRIQSKWNNSRAYNSEMFQFFYFVDVTRMSFAD
jgi:hypothetical protein